MKPLVSVIVPVYNTSKYLRQCLDSIQFQTLKEIEIICVDDGSTDDSLLILYERALGDSRIKILTQENKGGGAARNLGMTAAKGEYLLFLDSDDFFEEIFIEKMYNTAVKTSADIVACQYTEYNTNTGVFSEINGVNPRLLSRKKTRVFNELPTYYLGSLSLVPWNKLYHHKFLQENGHCFQEIKHYNDNYFSVTTSLSANTIAIIPDVLIYYRVGMKTNTQSTHYENPYDQFEVISAVYQYLRKTNMFQNYEYLFYEYMINSCIGHLKKLEKCDCYKDVYLYTIQTFNKYDLSNFSLRKCQNKLTYMRLLRLRTSPYSKYINDKNGDYLLYLLKHPLIVLSIGGYLLKNTWWHFTAYGFKNTLQRVISFIH